MANEHKHVYLAGRMTGLGDRGAGWRDSATVLLAPLVCEDPLKLELPSHNPSDIVATDLAAIERSAAVLVYVGIPSWGTAMEIWHAKQRGIPVIGFTGPDFNEPLSPWVRYACNEICLGTLAQAVARVREMLL